MTEVQKKAVLVKDKVFEARHEVVATREVTSATEDVAMAAVNDS